MNHAFDAGLSVAGAFEAFLRELVLRTVVDHGDSAQAGTATTRVRDFTVDYADASALGEYLQERSSETDLIADFSDWKRFLSEGADSRRRHVSAVCRTLLRFAEQDALHLYPGDARRSSDHRVASGAFPISGCVPADAEGRTVGEDLMQLAQVASVLKRSKVVREQRLVFVSATGPSFERSQFLISVSALADDGGTDGWAALDHVVPKALLFDCSTARDRSCAAKTAGAEEGSRGSHLVLAVALSDRRVPQREEPADVTSGVSDADLFRVFFGSPSRRVAIPCRPRADAGHDAFEYGLISPRRLERIFFSRKRAH